LKTINHNFKVREFVLGEQVNAELFNVEENFKEINTTLTPETTETIKTKLGVATETADGYLSYTDWVIFNLKQAALGYTPEDANNKDQALGYVGLDADGKINPSQLPAQAITNTFVVSSQAEMLALNAAVGDVAIRTDQNKTYILRTLPPTVLANWAELLFPTSDVTSVFGRTAAVTAQSGDYTTDQITETVDHVFLSTAQKTVVENTSGTNTGDETATRIAVINHGSTEKTILLDADEITGQNSANSFSLIRTTWANVKSFLKTYFDTIYASISLYVPYTGATGNVNLGAHSLGTPEIKTNTTAAADLIITTGLEKTIVFATPTYRDEYPAMVIPAGGAAAPDAVPHTIGLVNRTLYGFDGAATQEILSGSFEIPHDYMVGQPIEVHVHWRPSASSVGTVVWYFDYEYSPANGVPIPQPSISVSHNITSDSQYKHFLDTFGNLPQPTTPFSLGGKIGFNIRRTPTADTYGADALLEQVALHIPCDTNGSRQIYVK